MERKPRGSLHQASVAIVAKGRGEHAPRAYMYPGTCEHNMFTHFLTCVRTENCEKVARNLGASFAKLNNEIWVALVRNSYLRQPSDGWLAPSMALRHDWSTNSGRARWRDL